jgi:hypothetical protein
MGPYAAFPFSQLLNTQACYQRNSQPVRLSFVSGYDLGAFFIRKIVRNDAKKEARRLAGLFFSLGLFTYCVEQ